MMADDSSSPLQMFMAMTCLDQDTAANYLEMSGGDLESALGLFYSTMDAPSSSFDPPSSPSASPSSSPEDLPATRELKRVIFSSPSVPDQWASQPLSFGCQACPPDWGGLLIFQPKNGPCGLLAALQAVLVANLMRDRRLLPGVSPSPQDVYRAVATILLRIAALSDRVVRLARWSDPEHTQPAIDAFPLPAEDPAPPAPLGSADEQDPLWLAFSAALPQYAAAGGALLLLYSAVATRTPQRVAQDMVASGAEPMLVQGLFHSCTSGLMNLLLIGRAEDNMSAYNMAGDKTLLAPTPSDVGLLSVMESELKILINDTLKRPNLPVYIFHGRDHFTIAFQPINPPLPSESDVVPSQSSSSPSSSSNTTSIEDSLSSDAAADKAPARLEFVHLNGLPPAGPRVTRFWVTPWHGEVSVAPPTAAQGIGVEYKPVIGAIDSIVQAHPGDRQARPKQWTTWRYEVALVIDDPSNTSPELPADHPRPPTFQLQDAVPEAALRQDDASVASWRCRACYETRYKTMCFGMNEAPASLSPEECVCRHCEKTKRECGWTLWLRYDELGGWRGHCDKEYGPQINHLINSKWPGCDIEFETPDDPPSI